MSSALLPLFFFVSDPLWRCLKNKRQCTNVDLLVFSHGIMSPCVDKDIGCRLSDRTINGYNNNQRFCGNYNV